MKKVIFLFIGLVTLLFSETISKDVDKETQESYIVLPYFFDSDSMGLTYGLAGIFNGYIQPNMTIGATIWGGESQEVRKYEDFNNYHKEDSNAKGFALAITDYNPDFISDRLFLTLIGTISEYPKQHLYIDGANDTDKNEDESKESLSPFVTSGDRDWVYLKFRYVLPIGEGRENPITEYDLKNGFVVNRDDYGGGVPFESGRSIVEIRPFYSKATLDKTPQNSKWESLGIRFMFEHDNTDYIDNPSRGYNFQLAYTKDFGGSHSYNSWDSLEGEFSYYHKLPDFEFFDMQTIAFNIFTAYYPSWEHDNRLGNYYAGDSHRPPPFEGPALGGWNRLRAYDSYRYQDKALMYYGVEYRVIPKFNPFRNSKWLPIDIDWFQGALFAEAGQVNDEYDLGELHKDMKGDIGFSLRALAAKVPVRFDVAWGEEGSNMWVFLKQPF